MRQPSPGESGIRSSLRNRRCGMARQQVTRSAGANERVDTGKHLNPGGMHHPNLRVTFGRPLLRGDRRITADKIHQGT